MSEDLEKYSRLPEPQMINLNPKRLFVALIETTEDVYEKRLSVQIISAFSREEAIQKLDEFYKSIAELPNPNRERKLLSINEQID